MTCTELAQRLASTSHQPARGIHASAKGQTFRVVNNNSGTDTTYLVFEADGHYHAIANNGTGRFPLGPVVKLA
jgi:hypothetical protein